MKSLTLLALCASATASILPADQAVFNLEPSQQPSSNERYLIELSPGETRWVTEEEKWALKRKGQNFMDITNFQDLGQDTEYRTARSVTFPSNISYTSDVAPLLKRLNKKNMHDNLEKFSSFYTRYYKSDYGAQSSAWLLGRINETITASGAQGVSVKAFPHEWKQSSIIATIPGKSKKTIVIGAHQDSTNLFLPSLLAAPGADDDGSGTVTILEAFRVFLNDSKVAEGKMDNTVEFHWYSAEEGGLLGSQAIFSSYSREKRDIKAMLQQDMTGYVAKTLQAGKEESVGVITDYVDPGLTSFIKKVIETYCDIPWVETQCGYACSDHASASKAGYASAFVIESAFEDSDPNIHTQSDTLDKLSFDHMLQHARMTLGLTYELAFAKFD